MRFEIRLASHVGGSAGAVNRRPQAWTPCANGGDAPWRCHSCPTNTTSCEKGSDPSPWMWGGRERIREVGKTGVQIPCRDNQVRRLTYAPSVMCMRIPYEGDIQHRCHMPGLLTTSCPSHEETTQFVCRVLFVVEQCHVATNHQKGPLVHTRNQKATSNAFVVDPYFIGECLRSTLATLQCDPFFGVTSHNSVLGTPVLDLVRTTFQTPDPSCNTNARTPLFSC